MRQKTTQVNIQFKRPPNSIFELTERDDFARNVLSICIQPDEGIHLTIKAKIPDQQIAKSVDMELHYKNAFIADNLPDAYERLILDAINGDAQLIHTQRRDRKRLEDRRSRHRGLELRPWRAANAMLRSRQLGTGRRR